MKEEFRSKFPKWIDTEEEQSLCLTDDIDSLAGATVLRSVKGWNIRHFYDFKSLNTSTDDEGYRAVGVDMAILKGRTFDNHVTLLNERFEPNSDSANPNAVCKINRNNYTEKYAMSTTLLIYSLYGIKLPSTELGKMMLLAIDSSYLGHYKGYRETQNNWFRKLGFEELIELQNRKTIDDFHRVRAMHNLCGKIWIEDDGTLHTDIDIVEIGRILELDLQLPVETFKLRREFARVSVALKKGKHYSNTKMNERLKPFSYALTSRWRMEVSAK